jgi:hypothetical protein
MTKGALCDMSLEEELREETLKWLERAESLLSGISGDSHFCENISAYLQDSKYFIRNEDPIRAFEAVVWAWAWMEIGLQLGVLHKQADDRPRPEKAIEPSGNEHPSGKEQ